MLHFLNKGQVDQRMEECELVAGHEAALVQQPLDVLEEDLLLGVSWRGVKKHGLGGRDQGSGFRVQVPSGGRFE